MSISGEMKSRPREKSDFIPTNFAIFKFLPVSYRRFLPITKSSEIAIEDRSSVKSRTSFRITPSSRWFTSEPSEFANCFCSEVIRQSSLLIYWTNMRKGLRKGRWGGGEGVNNRKINPGGPPLINVNKFDIILIYETFISIIWSKCFTYSGKCCRFNGRILPAPISLSCVSVSWKHRM